MKYTFYSKNKLFAILVLLKLQKIAWGTPAFFNFWPKTFYLNFQVLTNEIYRKVREMIKKLLVAS